LKNAAAFSNFPVALSVVVMEITFRLNYINILPKSIVIPGLKRIKMERRINRQYILFVNTRLSGQRCIETIPGD
jgi:hypothetical protein